LRIPRGVPKSGDSGYQGSDLQVPKKKPRKGHLSDEQKGWNRRLAKERIVAEHGIGKMKIWRIASDRYRNPPHRHTGVMKNVAGLHNRMYGCPRRKRIGRGHLNQPLLRNEFNVRGR